MLLSLCKAINHLVITNIVAANRLHTSGLPAPRGEKVKNTEERLVVLNRIARSVIEEARGMHPVYVFVRQSEDGLTVTCQEDEQHRIEKRARTRGGCLGARAWDS